MITWTEIMTECGNYREGFVAIFRRYEGQPTDEKDSRGRVVAVTMASFCRHMGLEQTTFRRWTKTGAAAAVSTRNRRAEAINRDPGGTVDDIMAAPEKVQDEIFHELKLRRAGVDTSRAARKGADAAAHAQAEPIRRAMASTEVALCVEAIKEATEHLVHATEAGVLNDEAMAEIGAAHEAFQFALTEARFKVS